MRAFLITGFNKRIQIMIAGRHAVFVITVFRTNEQRADSSPECVGGTVLQISRRMAAIIELTSFSDCIFKYKTVPKIELQGLLLTLWKSLIKIKTK